ncbi:MAG: DUF389 domain-containing protein [Bacteroidales bacterium]|nr:DUF389 domain-containing protein [Bacteroidales bacterium]
MSVWNSLRTYLSDTTSLGDQLDTSAAAAGIRRNIHFRGPNVWILAFSIIIASVGLNVNSTAVIIGAMLISPLMGPIIGLGLGLGINDAKLIGDALRNLLVMVFISLLASCIYFLLSPLNLAAPTELEARTSPSIYDVLIALFGGFAGILEQARKEKGTVLSGVAIATALMPPLCTAGYGLAKWNGHFFFGAMGLFVINAVFITLATYLSVKYFHFRIAQYEDERTGRRTRRLITAAVLLVTIPSVWSAITMIKSNNFAVASEQFISENRVYGKSYIYDYRVGKGRHGVLSLYVTGEALGPVEKLDIIEAAGKYGIPASKVEIIDKGLASDKTDASDKIMLGIYDRLEAQIARKDSTIRALRLRIEQLEAAIPPAPADSTDTNPAKP